MKKSAVIITPFFNYSYEVRIKYLYELLEKEYDVIIISSNFDHRTKSKYQIERQNVEQIETPSYKKNISFKRIRSHYIFSKKAAKRVLELKPNLLYVSGPPNYLFHFSSKLKKKLPMMKMIFEIGDMWPETMPVSSKMKLILSPILGIWSSLRNKSLKKADSVICECELFESKVSRYSNNTNVIYLCKDNYDPYTVLKLESDVLKFAYLGSINNIIDLDIITDFLLELQKYKEVEISIIGSGEKKEELISKLNEKNIPNKYFGNIYTNEEKCSILEKCHFGLNVMKSTVMVGATMKSLEYFHWGLALINTIEGDTEKMVNDFQCGFNISKSNIKELAIQISKMTTNEINQMRINSRKIFLEKFETNVVSNQLSQIIDNLGGK